MLVLDIPGDRTGSAGLRGGITSVKNIAEVYIQPFKCMGENRSYTECTEGESIQSRTIRNVGSDLSDRFRSIVRTILYISL